MLYKIKVFAGRIYTKVSRHSGSNVVVVFLKTLRMYFFSFVFGGVLLSPLLSPRDHPSIIRKWSFLLYEGNKTSVQPSQNRLPFPMVQILVKFKYMAVQYYAAFHFAKVSI